MDEWIGRRWIDGSMSRRAHDGPHSRSASEKERRARKRERGGPSCADRKGIAQRRGLGPRVRVVERGLGERGFRRERGE